MRELPGKADYGWNESLEKKMTLRRWSSLSVTGQVNVHNIL